MKTRNTIQKELVEKAILSLHTPLWHPSADHVYDEVAKEHPNISRATVYRILGQMEKQGQLRRITIPGTADRFDTDTSPHYHMYCLACGGVSDATLAYQENLGDYRINAEGCRIDPNGFRIDGHGIYMWGVCASCRGKAEEKEEQRVV